MFVLVIIAGPRAGARFELDRPALIGRGDAADVDLADPSVSRRHALLSLAEGGCRVSDLQSGNGTFLNGRQIAAAMLLRDGDVLQVGESRLEYLDRPETMSRESPPPPRETVEGDAKTRVFAVPIVRSPASSTGEPGARPLPAHDLDLARRVQQQLLPEASPQVPGYQLAFRYAPAPAIGGDVYDFLPLENGRLGVAVGALSAQGVAAALLSVRAMSDLRLLAGQGLAPAVLIERLSRRLASSTREALSMNLLYLEMEPASGALELVNAGHLRPLLRQTDGRVVAVDLPHGPAVGAEAQTTYRARPARLGAGEALVLYTGGVTAAVAPSGERFGETRLRQVISRASGEAEAITAAAVAAVQAFREGAAAEDDLTLVCLFREPFRKA